MSAPFSPEAVANRFVEVAKEKNSELSLMQLLKIVYFAHGWHLALAGKPLISEQVEAWKFGPVAPSVYHAFKGNGSSPITKPCISFDLEEYQRTGDLASCIPTIERTSSLDAFFEKIWNVYGKMSGFQLSQITHQPDSPWYKVWYEQGGSERKGTDIPDALITEYFKGKLASSHGLSSKA